MSKYADHRLKLLTLKWLSPDVRKKANDTTLHHLLYNSLTVTSRNYLKTIEYQAKSTKNMKINPIIAKCPKFPIINPNYCSTAKYRKPCLSKHTRLLKPKQFNFSIIVANKYRGVYAPMSSRNTPLNKSMSDIRKRPVDFIREQLRTKNVLLSPENNTFDTKAMAIHNMDSENQQQILDEWNHKLYSNHLV